MNRVLELRKAGGKLKVQHSILGNLRPVLEKICKENEEIKTIIPGSIKHVTSAQGKAVKIRVTIPIANGHKVIALANGARQELFVSTSLKAQELGDAFVAAGASIERSSSSSASHASQSQSPPPLAGRGKRSATDLVFSDILR